MMKKKVVKKTGSTIDAATIDEFAKKFESVDFIDSKTGKKNEDLKSKLITYIELLKELLISVEHSKMTIAKLQKLFGFSTMPIQVKEV